MSPRSPSSSYLFFFFFSYPVLFFSFSFGKMEPGLNCTMRQCWSGPSGRPSLSGGWTGMNGQQNVLGIHKQWARALHVCACVDEAMRWLKPWASAATFSSDCLTCPNCSIKIKRRWLQGACVLCVHASAENWRGSIMLLRSERAARSRATEVRLRARMLRVWHSD